jgi:hypothetical protein
MVRLGAHDYCAHNHCDHKPRAVRRSGVSLRYPPASPPATFSIFLQQCLWHHGYLYLAQDGSQLMSAEMIELRSLAARDDDPLPD